MARERLNQTGTQDNIDPATMEGEFDRDDILREDVDASLVAQKAERAKREERWLWFHGLRYGVYTSQEEALERKREEGGKGNVVKRGRFDALPIPIVVAAMEHAAGNGLTIAQLAGEFGFTTYDPAKIRRVAHKAYKAYNDYAKKIDEPTKGVPVIADGVSVDQLAAMFATK